MKLSRREFTTLAASAAAAYCLPRFAVAASAEAAADGGLASLTLAEAAAKFKAGAVTSVQLTEACLARIGIYGPKLDAFITVLKQKALAQAQALDAEMKAGKYRGPLHGIPIAIKDNIDTAGTRTTAASAVYEDRVPTQDATVITRLVEAGAVIIGKTNLEEFAMGGGETSYFGPARNPWSLAHNTGGSSSGSGAAIAAHLCYGALGTDTGGSVRMPASYCGVVGLKPTYGLVPIRGIVPLVVSLDHCGPITRSVEDNAIMLTFMTGYDKFDITSAEHPKEDYLAAAQQPVTDFRLGVPVGYFDHLDPEVAKAVDDAITLLSGMTKGAREVALPTPVQTGSVGCEIIAYQEDNVKKSAARFMLPHRRRLEAQLAAPPKAADYVRAKWELDLLRRTIDDAFTDFDLVVLPTQRILPPLLNDLIKAAHNAAPIDPNITSNCGPFDAFGIPAISIPCGFSKSGLPIGLMIAGPRFSEGKVLALANAYEKATQWRKRQPPLTPETPVPPVVTS